MATIIERHTYAGGGHRRRTAALRVLGALVAANAAVFVGLRLCAAVSPGFAGEIVAALSLPSQPPELAMRPWSLMTYMFTQYDELHVILNMLWLCWFGLLLADSGARGRFIALTYMAGGLAAGAGYMLLAPSPDGFMIGSSGAVMAVVTAAATAAPDKRIDLPLVSSVRLATAATVIVGISVGCLSWGTGAGHVAHIAGAAAGIASGVLLRRSRRNTRRGSEAPRSGDDGHGVLDKLRTSGYDSLTAAERAILVRTTSPGSKSDK